MVIVFVLISGCANMSMVPLKKNARSLQLEKNSLLLMRFATMNHYDPLFTPKISSIQFYNLNTRKKFSFAPYYEDQKADALGYNHYWLALYLPPGEYLIEKIEAKAYVTMISSSFKIRPFTKFTLPPQSISYAGLLEISSGKPISNGSTVPSSSTPLTGNSLLGSALAGYLTDGAFQIRLLDNSKEDIASYRFFYPSLAQREILINLGK